MPQHDPHTTANVRTSGSIAIASLAPTTPQYAGTETIGPRSSVDDGMAWVFSAALARWLAAIPAASRRHNAEGIHQLRVALRRMRSMLSVLKSRIPTRQRTELDAEIKWLITSLAPVRDLDVLYHDLLVPLQSSRKFKNHQILTNAIAEQRSAAQERALAALTSARHRKLVDDVETWIDSRAWRNGNIPRAQLNEAVGRAIRKLLNARLRKILKDGKKITKLSAEELHELRISLKKLRYGISFFKPALPSRAKKLSKTLAALQDSLGRLNDATVASVSIARLIASAKTAKSRDMIKAAGKQLVAYHKKAAADVWPDIAPQWKALKKFGTL